MRGRGGKGVSRDSDRGVSGNRAGHGHGAGAPGAKVLFTYLLRSREEAEKTLRAAVRLGREVEAVQGDVGDYEACRAVVERAIRLFGRIDILVNNAGILARKPLTEMEPEEWRRLFEVNVFGALNMSRLVLPHMLSRRRGVIINVSSVTGIRPPGPGRTVYAATKAALIGFTKGLAREVAMSGVRVVGVAPGLIDTEMPRQHLPNLEERAKAIPLRRIGRPEEVAHAILFLIENDFIDGEVIVVSGGD